MPPMPLPPGIGGAGSFGNSATMASVVTRRAATEAASCSAARTTLAGSMMPFDHVDILLGLRIEAESLRLVLEDLADHDRAFDPGILGDLADRRLQRFQHDIDVGLHIGIVVADAPDGLLGA